MIFKFYYDKYEQAKPECYFLIWNGTIKSCCTTVYLKHSTLQRRDSMYKV